MKYAILVHPVADWRTSQQHTRYLCDSLLASGAEITAVLFYGEATNIAHPQSEHHWHDWNQSICPLLVCSTLYQNTVVKSDPITNAPFTVTGLARWMQLSEQATQVVTIS